MAASGFFLYAERRKLNACRLKAAVGFMRAGGDAGMDLGYKVILTLIAVYICSSLVLYWRARGFPPDQKK